ncbi:MAG TPA: hypothetical protein VFV19_04425 [Candidatus Polarisedimenticolaceae bacterium]|nr:hypothetical protein [Candidatus Polarisedimenticolaceae bacterium]
MERAPLRLVRDDPRPKRSPRAAALGLAVLATGTVATFLGADASRHAPDPAELAESALAATLSGADPSAAEAAIARLRARLAAVPLDPTARTALANLTIEAAGASDARELAAAQALTATRLAPSDAVVARAAARVLARCGREVDALATVRTAFRYAPDQAAIALADVEPFVSDSSIEGGIPETPAAWLAWSIRLRTMGREQEADDRLASLLGRWPDDPRALLVAAGVAAGRDRLDEIDRLLPASRTLPEARETAALFAYRARARAGRDDADGARADAAHALALDGDGIATAVACGDALMTIDPSQARRLWTGAVYRLEALGAGGDSLLWVRFRLARLDDREGRGADALRTWRSILAARPDSEEAQRRVRELSGGSVR